MDARPRMAAGCAHATGRSSNVQYWRSLHYGIMATLQHFCSSRASHGMARSASALLTQRMASSIQLGALSSCCSRPLPHALQRRPTHAPSSAAHWAFWQLATSWHLSRQQHLALHAAAVASRSTDTMVDTAAATAAPDKTATQPSVLEGTLLDACVGPGLRLMEQRFDIGGHVFTMLAPHDVDQVLDMYIEAGIEGDPYWCRVWPSAIALAQLLLSQPELVRGKRVADVGCGLGVAGIAAALAGASEVVLLDREPLALQCALTSAVASGVAGVEADMELLGQHAEYSRNGSSSGSGGGGSCTIPTNSTAATPGAVLKAKRFDWSAPDVSAAAGGRFDVLLACDVLYEADAVDPLSTVMPQLLKSASGLLLLADPPNRTASTLNREAFLGRLSAAASSGRAGGGAFTVDECYVHACEVTQLDGEIVGGLSSSETVPVQLLVVRRSAGNSTVGVKRWAAA